MRPILQALSSRWVLTAFGVLAASVMLWMFGPMLSVLEGWLPRIVAMGVMTLAWLGANAAVDHLRRQADRKLSAGITGVDLSKAPDAVAGVLKRGATAAGGGAEDVAEQRARLDRAMRLLRQARGTRGYLYEQPWYVIIGPPGAGKTTALANSGLRFPLAEELAGGEIRGVGGTRFCDWSFTDEAVLIDTAGRYTTQDSDAAADKEGWDGFLALLRRTRPRQPLNGVLVAISITDIALAPEAERRAHARAIRSRIKELYSKLGARLPVYAVFTKLDLIQGFTDFFDNLDRERRAQVWGVTFPLKTDHAGPAPAFPAEFQALTAQLSVRLVDRLQTERSPERRTAIADFPVQFASLQAPLADFVEQAFGGTRIDPAPFLRGVYFASGTQEGSPIDRLTGALARNFGIDQRQAAALRPAHGRSYFLETLLKQVVFGEAMLLTANPQAARRRRWLRVGAWSTAGVVTLAGLAALFFATYGAGNRSRHFAADLAAYQQALAGARLDPVPLAGNDLPRVKPLLDQAHALVAEAAVPAHALGLSQQAKLAAAADLAYRRALERILLPRLVSELEDRMRTRAADLDYLYRATRVYLILCGKGPMDPGMVREWLEADWAETYAGASLAPFRTDLRTHLDALLSRPITTFVTPDPDLLARSQARLANISVADRAYALLRSSEAATAPPPFVPADAIGPLATSHFTRHSGRPLTDPVPGLFTVAGYRSVILPNMPKATEQAIRESWVLGQASQIDANDVRARQAVEQAVIAHYAHDYQATWDGLLSDLDVVPPADPASAVGDFRVLTSPRGPIKLLLAAVVKQFALADPPPAPAPAAGGAAPAPAAPAAPADPAIKAVDEHFHDLRDYVEKDQIDDVLGALQQLQQQIFSQVAASAAAGVALTPGMDAAQTLSRMAAGAPQPVARWLQSLAQRGGAVRDDVSRQQAAAAYGGAGGPAPLCQQVVQKFPFRPAARDDVPLDAFADLFAPNGRFDTFFTQFVRPYVDTTGRDWRLRDQAGSQTPVTPEALAQLQRALTIRDTFFGFGGGSGTTRPPPSVRFALRPLSLDPGATGVKLDFGGITATWAAGDTGAKVFDWPGPTHMTSVRVDFTPAGSGADLQQTGPWALFRLLAQGQLEPVGAGESYTLTLLQGERQARFDLSAGSAHSPFDAALLTGFRCPVLRP